MTTLAWTGRPASATGPGAWWRSYRVELAKLAAEWRTRLALGACVVGPLAFAFLARALGILPADTPFGRWLPASGFADPLVVLNFAGQWLLPVLIAVVAGDMFAAEDRLGTWRTLLVGSRSVHRVFVAKAAAAASWTVVLVVVLGAASIAGGVLAGGTDPLVGLSGQQLAAPAATRLVTLSWLLALAPALAFTALSLLFSVAFRRSPVAVGAPILLALLLQLVVLAPLPVALRTVLPVTPFTTWHGLFTIPRSTVPLWLGLVVSAGWAVAATAGAYLLLTRRDFAAGGRVRSAAGSRRRRAPVTAAFVVTGALAIVVPAVAVPGATAPGSGITGAKLDSALATTFAHLYQRQQAELGHPAVTPAGVDATASCHNGGTDTADLGPGNGWHCVVSWHVVGAETPARALYQLQVSPDGRFTADGDGPKSVNGYTTVPTPRGPAANPLWQFDGLLDLTARTSPPS